MSRIADDLCAEVRYQCEQAEHFKRLWMQANDELERLRQQHEKIQAAEREAAQELLDAAIAVGGMAARLPRHSRKTGGSMNHTETPWVLCQQDGAKLAYTIFASSQLKAGRIEVAEWDSYVALAGGLNSGNAEANARRIVACVNACAGISTENLEDNLPVKELADRYNALQKHCDGFAKQAAFQRDARLGALKELAIVKRQRDELLSALVSYGHKSGCEKNAFGAECTCGIDAVISSVKGGAE